MRKLLGYCAHLASVRLHEVAVGWLRANREPHEVPDHKPVIWCSERLGDDIDLDVIRLPDVAPRLAAAIDWGRERWQQVAWLAGGGGMGR